MLIAEILRAKGTRVETITPDATVADLLTRLARRNIGAAVVVRDGTVAGIASERDVVRRLEQRGSGLLADLVSEIMTAAVITCAPDDTVDTLTVVMTENRVRHVPVLSAGRLVGIVSIGDVVKSRIQQLEQDRRQLESYITQG
ncbi:CBS domain-containing protein [Streptomonospora nanhaiensis]|uniref:CBS domain-containing protein n=1 Tax=Streptomonospora nanhaiensis TaxID=1323731 RepID=A0A853BVV8_9ACTN|nr:CBS domain-containing protein [Streptomonospora nanhaiensis]MBV2363589.1 CBS domain-containing protein [Streptomonospora nanhaiensis]MBX9391975.1 CBS domain-containing protein [Streptomonospora nanhaiensis]NYI98631.1 CBS domain-containing protein [Streptomonospora nanhaiensis]